MAMNETAATVMSIDEAAKHSRRVFDGLTGVLALGLMAVAFFAAGATGIGPSLTGSGFRDLCLAIIALAVVVRTSRVMDCCLTGPALMTAAAGLALAAGVAIAGSAYVLARQSTLYDIAMSWLALALLLGIIGWSLLGVIGLWRLRLPPRQQSWRRAMGAVAAAQVPPVKVSQTAPKRQQRAAPYLHVGNALSVAALAAAVLLYFYLAQLDFGLGASERNTIALLASVVMGIVMMAPAYLVFRRAQQIEAPGADAVLQVDGRAPLLLLRSFQDDGRLVRARMWPWGPRLEEALANELGRLGPVIAIGAPGEGLPRLGAARAYFDAATWKDAISDWLGRAQLVVLMAGRTEGLAWEIEAIRRRGLASKLMVVLPATTAQDRRKRWAHVAGMLGVESGANSGEIDVGRALVAVFDEDLTPMVICCSNSSVMDCEIAVRLGLHAVLARAAVS